MQPAQLKHSVSQPKRPISGWGMGRRGYHAQLFMVLRLYLIICVLLIRGVLNGKMLIEHHSASSPKLLFEHRCGKVLMSSLDSQSLRRKGLDHISELPDTILCIILSFLNTNTAVKTSVLSKRWKYVWTQVPALDITGWPRSRSMEQRVCFKRFVHNVLLLNDVPYLQRLRLHLSEDIDAFYVNSWMNAISCRETCELDVKLLLPSYYSTRDLCLPTRFLCSERLVTLKIEACITINSSVCFQLPHLQTIHLYYVEFPDDEFMRRLSSSCPVLKELHIVSCTGLTANLLVDSLSLESLQITKVFGDGYYDEVVPCISITAPNLGYLALDDSLTVYDISDMILLTTAMVFLHYSSLGVDESYAYKLLSKVSGVKTLQLGSNIFSVESNIPVFHNLTCLKLEPNDVTFGLLVRAPMLKQLILESTNGWSHWYCPENEPEPLNYLESVDICVFYGGTNDVSFVKFILKAATVLKELRINMNHLEERSKTSVYESLLMLPRSSPGCQVKTVHDVELTFPAFCSYL